MQSGGAECGRAKADTTTALLEIDPVGIRLCLPDRGVLGVCLAVVQTRTSGASVAAGLVDGGDREGECEGEPQGV